MSRAHDRWAGALDQAIFAVLAAGETPVGVAFLCGDNVLVTCAHVLDAACPSEVDGPVRVTQPLSSTAPHTVHRARVLSAIPARPDGTGDIAVLRIDRSVPHARPVRLVETTDVWGHTVRTFGFPSGRAFGVWHEGVLRARQAHGWVQVDSPVTGYGIEGGFSGAPVWDPELAGVVGMVVAADTGSTRSAFVIPTDALVTAWPQLRESTMPPPPYRGLLPFRERDEEIFFGRDGATAELVSQIASAPVLAVVGASGSGKSSLAQAGVLPHVRRRGWTAAVVRGGDGSAPVSALGAALLPLLEPGSSAVDRIADLPSFTELLAERGMADVVPRVLEAAEASALVVVIDQAEQLLELDDGEVAAFLDMLLPANRPDALHVVATIRADRLEAALAHGALSKVLAGRTFLVPRMTAAEIEQAVCAPLNSTPGIRFEPGLVARIVDDAGSDPGVLPLLGNTLMVLCPLCRRRHNLHYADLRIMPMSA